MRLLVTAALVVVSLFGSVCPAAAQTVEPFALDRFEPSPAGDRFFAVPGADVGGHGRVSAGLVGDYAYRPLVLYAEDGEDDAGNAVRAPRRERGALGSAAGVAECALRARHER